MLTARTQIKHMVLACCYWPEYNLGTLTNILIQIFALKMKTKKGEDEELRQIFAAWHSFHNFSAQSPHIFWTDWTDSQNSKIDESKSNLIDLHLSN